ncbi:MAG: hypothetical protein JXA69_20120 [Phycisphaerae bacterium]|nr:hypothetical protein [Phycisphaerae bacterium]
MKSWLAMLLLIFPVGASFARAVAAAESDTTAVRLNGLGITLDRNTGSILRLEYAGPGAMLDASPEKASLVDLAYPVKDFEPLRLATRFSKNAHIDVQSDQVTIHWNRLGASRSVFEQVNAVAATVTLKAAQDGRSIIMSCRVENNSDVAVRQVIFPDLMGLVPFEGPDQTRFRTANFVRTPFRDLMPDEGRLSLQFCQDPAAGMVEYKSGGMFSDMWLRWMDLGGYKGGLSLFQKAWGWDPRVPVRLHLDPEEPKLRLLCVHLLTIEPGATWESGEFVLTPHANGWAAGIEPYAEWAKAHLKKEYPMPKHVRDGLGFRTLWMSKGFPKDPQDAIWKFEDLPALARESKQHGLDEMVMWGYAEGFKLPLPPPHPHLGTEKDLVDAIRQCREMGVNVAPFISVLQAGHETGTKYGLTVPREGGWPQHPEAIPPFQATYISLLQCAGVDTNNALWQKEVRESCKHYIDIGIPSLSWDQFWTEPNLNIIKIVSEVRAEAKKVDPESTFSSEELWNMEIDADYLDYTWNWGGFRDCQAFTSVFPSPRISCIVTAAPDVVAMAFLDNLYLNVFPRKAGAVNGTDWIAHHPELSKMLMKCAALRKQFLEYFTAGRFIGDCLLSEPCPNAHVAGYVLPDRALLLVLNRGGTRLVPFQCDLTPWLNSRKGWYIVRQYDSTGGLTTTHRLNGRLWKSEATSMEPLEIALFEITPGHP